MRILPHLSRPWPPSGSRRRCCSSHGICESNDLAVLAAPTFHHHPRCRDASPSVHVPTQRARRRPARPALVRFRFPLAPVRDAPVPAESLRTGLSSCFLPCRQGSTSLPSKSYAPPALPGRYDAATPSSQDALLVDDDNDETTTRSFFHRTRRGFRFNGRFFVTVTPWRGPSSEFRRMRWGSRFRYGWRRCGRR
jgi:hypothetical protein